MSTDRGTVAGGDSSGTVAAVDLGVTSGRVMLGHVGPDELRLESVARFPNGPVRQHDGLHWDFSALYAHVLAGLTEAVQRAPELASIGVDAWAVDYGLLAGDRMLGEPFNYRDERTAAGVASVHTRVGAEELYARNGLQHLPFNSLFQLDVDRATGALARADRFLLIPDLLSDLLTGVAVAERTNASTTGLLGVETREWDQELIARLDLPWHVFAPLVEPGTPLGALRADVARMLGASDRLGITAVGSHDTASAVVAVPSTRDDFAYISCGTWGLVGVELEHPVLSAASRAANFTNEGGVDARVRYLHNVMGLWLLSETVREWDAQDAAAAGTGAAPAPIDLPQLLAEAAAYPHPVPVFDADDEVFLAPDDMPARIERWFVERGVEPPKDRVATTRSIIESLAEAFARSVHTAAELSGRDVSVIHIVGGGSQNELLCQLTADHSGLPVLAGPVEATALGNVLVQARAAGFATGSLESLRALVATAFAPRRHEPRSAASRVGSAV